MHRIYSSFDQAGFMHGTLKIRRTQLRRGISHTVAVGLADSLHPQLAVMFHAGTVCNKPRGFASA